MPASSRLEPPYLTSAGEHVPTPRILVPSLAESRILVRLAAPVMVAQVGLLAMGLVDTWLVGKLGRPHDLAAVALGDACFFTVLVLAVGVIQALDALISQAHGAADAGKCAAAWRAGVRMALLLTLPVALAIWVSVPLLRHVTTIDAHVLDLTSAYVASRLAGVLPWLLYSADRSLLNGLGATVPTMVVTLLANVFNVVLTYALVFGVWGAPALGVVGAGLATAACSWFMYLALAAWMLRHPRYAPYRAPGALPPGLLRLVARLGFPLGLTHALEVGAFSVASVFVGTIGVVPLAGHQLAIKMASTSYMVAVAVGVATSVRVGTQTGAGNPTGAAHSGWTGLALGAAWMSVAGVLFLVFRTDIAGWFTPDPAVIAAGAALLVVAAAFQVVDGIQAVASGALRGLGDTRFPMLANLGAYWFVALPLGGVLGFPLGYGAEGVWWALAIGLLLAAIVLVLRFRAMQGAKALEQP